MMHQDNRSFLLAVLALVAAAVVCVSVASTAGPAVSQQAFDYMARPQSPAGLILESRQIAPAVADRGMGAAGWLAVGLVTAAALSALLYFGSQALRQWRLTRGRSKPHQRPLVPQLPPPYPVQDVPFLPGPRRVPYLPEGGNHES